MATRSAIAIKHGRNTIKSVYCHWDGYPEHNGRILQEYWYTPIIINQLIEMGDNAIKFSAEFSPFNFIRLRLQPQPFLLSLVLIPKHQQV